MENFTETITLKSTDWHLTCNCTGVREWQGHDEWGTNLLSYSGQVIRQWSVRPSYLYPKYQRSIIPHYSLYGSELNPSLCYVLLKKRLMCHHNVNIISFLKTCWTRGELSTTRLSYLFVMLCQLEAEGIQLIWLNAPLPRAELEKFKAVVKAESR